MTMAQYIVLLLVWSVSYLNAVGGIGIHDLLTESCGFWDQYTEAKCIKVITEEGSFTKAEAESICDAENAEHFPQTGLVTIKTQEEQKFLHNYLFKKQGIKGPVWLKVKQDDNESNSNNMSCVESEPEDEDSKSGQLVRVNCSKSNVVVCERQPISPMTFLESLWPQVKEYVNDTWNTYLDVFKELSNSSSEESSLSSIELEKLDLNITRGLNTDTPDNIALSQTNSGTNVNATTIPELNDLLQRLHTAETVISLMIRFNKNVVKEINSIKYKSETVDEVMQSAKEEIMKTTEKVDALEINYNLAKMRIRAAEQSNEDFKVRIESIEERTAATHSSIITSKQFSDGTNLEISKLQQQYSVCDKEMKAVKEKNDIVEMKISDLEQIYDAANKELTITKEMTQTAEVTINDMKRKSEEVEKDLNDCKKRDGVFEARLTVLSNQKLAADTEIDSFKVKIEKAENEILTHSGMNELLEKKITSLEETNQAAGDEIFLLKEKCFGLEKVLDETLQKHKAAANTTSSLEKKIGVLETNTTFLNHKNEELSGRIENMNETVNTLKQNIDVSENLVEQTREATNTELTALKQWRDEIDMQLITEKEINNITVTIRDIKQENAVTKTEVEEIRKLNKEVHDNINELKQRHKLSETKLGEVEKSTIQVKQAVDDLKKNPVPIGFLYVQLPLHESPTILWPTLGWKNVSPDYAGLFFRVEGGKSAPFGEVQEDNTRHLVGANSTYNLIGKTIFKWGDISSSGTWSNYIYTGSSLDGKKVEGIQFKLSTGEVRPKNQAARIWLRVK